MKIAYFDCIAGASGDMILGALIDAGLPEAALRERLTALKLVDFELRSRRVQKHTFSATKVDVIVAKDVPERHLADILAIVDESELPAAIRAQATAIFRRIGEAEAAIHGTDLAHVRLHELGGVDTIVDVVGALVGLDALGIERVYASPLPLGRGFIRGSHGQIPLPAPATVSLLKGAPVIGSEIEMELVTPTGAALLSTLAAGFGPIPPMTLTAVGYGAGGRDLAIPNVLRLLIGEDAAIATHPEEETVTVLETNIDDLNPEIYDYVMARLFGAGALDVFLSPIQMKKNRPAVAARHLPAPCCPGVDRHPLRRDEHAGRPPADHDPAVPATHDRGRGDAVRERPSQGGAPAGWHDPGRARVRGLPAVGRDARRAAARGLSRRAGVDAADSRWLMADGGWLMADG